MRFILFRDQTFDKEKVYSIKLLRFSREMIIFMEGGQTVIYKFEDGIDLDEQLEILTNTLNEE